MEPQPPHTFDALVLLTRGGYGQSRTEPLANLLLTIQNAFPTMQVVAAYVDQGTPNLPSVLQAVAGRGARQILVQPIFLPTDKSLVQWLSKVIMRWLVYTWAGDPVDVALAESLAHHPALGDAILTIVDEEAENATLVTDTPPANWEQDPTGWSNLPEHSHHLFFCRGPRCTALAEKLRDELRTHKRLQGDRVLVAQTGCLFPCNHGPVMVLYPEGIWYGRLTPSALSDIVRLQLLEGTPVEGNRIR
jgi:(2Fe-2S) ferredoxin